MPSISIPTDPATKELDPVVRRLADVLAAHKKGFTGGSFVNAASELHFAGGAKGVNALLADLAGIDGATVRVRLSKEAGVTQLRFPAPGAAPPPACDCRVEHGGWGAARVVTVTVYLGGGRVDPADLELPAIGGRAAPPGK